jgi:RHS repeat-associated protein
LLQPRLITTTIGISQSIRIPPEPRRTTTTYTYDALNRLTGRSSNSPHAEPPVSFTYTATGKYHTSTAQDGTVNYTYDALDRLITKATPEGTLTYHYYSTGMVESIQSSNTNGANVSYTYDGLNRLSTVVDNHLPSNNTTTYTYDNASNVVTVAYPNGVTSTSTYDELNRLTELSTSASGTQIANYSYTLGLTGNRTNATEQSGRTLQWSYNGIYQLTNESITGDPANNDGNNGYASYTLDPVGNRTGATSTFSGFSPGFGSYNPNDQISTETYDSNGNVIGTANGNSYVYDSENRMIQMVKGTTTITMKYDAFGNRVSKAVTTAGVTTTTQYLVDDLNPTGYAQVLDELTGPIGSAAVSRTYTYGLQRISQVQITGNVLSYYQYDGGGSVRQLTNSAGQVTDSYEYDAFGNSFTKVGTTPNNYLYRGEQYDSDLSLYYLRARYYNPLTGRFLSRDPYEPKLRDSHGRPIDPKKFHKYLYAGGDPVNALDPTGKDALFDDLMIEFNGDAADQYALEETETSLKKVFDCVAFMLTDAAAGTVHWSDLLDYCIEQNP